MFLCDATKDLSKRARVYEEQEEDYSGNKGHGKSHTLYTDLFGRPIRVEAGRMGRENDRGCYIRGKRRAASSEVYFRMASRGCVQLHVVPLVLMPL